MKKYAYFSITIIGALLFHIQLAVAEISSWSVDNAHSNFYFSVDHIYSKVRGHFNEFTAEVKFDEKNLADSSFTFQINTASVDTNIAKRDKHLQSEDFFDSRLYPTMTFQSAKITDLGNGGYEVFGKFTVKGKVYDLAIPLTLAGIKAHPAVKGKDVAGFNGKISIDRLVYGVGNGKFYEIGVVGKDVDILISLELLREQ